MSNTAGNSFDESIAGRGLRMTEQRRAVYDAFMAQADHPTAVEVFMRVKTKLPNISLATVYNCLQSLVEGGVIRHVHHDRESSRFCANLAEHAHLFCDSCGSVTDLPMRPNWRSQELWEFPAATVITGGEVSFRGLCANCAPNGVTTPSTPDRPSKKSKS